MLIQLVHVLQLQSFLGLWNGRSGKMASVWGTLRPIRPIFSARICPAPTTTLEPDKNGFSNTCCPYNPSTGFLTSIPTLQWEHNSLYQVRIKGGEICQVLKLRTKSITIYLILHFFSIRFSFPTSPNIPAQILLFACL